MSNLEELVIHNARPSSLGVKALKALVVHPVHENNMGTTATPGGGYTPLCPSLKRFGLRYRRWLRPSEHFDLIPELKSIISSRKGSKFSLQNVHIWRGSEDKDPLELIEGSGISLEGFERLANGNRKDLLVYDKFRVQPPPPALMVNPFSRVLTRFVGFIGLSSLDRRSAQFVSLKLSHILLQRKAKNMVHKAKTLIPTILACCE